MPIQDDRTDPSRFWSLIDELVATSEIVIDRPGGSAHPRVPTIIYPFDYGYLANTVGGDGDGIDAWRGSLPEARVTGIIATVSMPQRDAEVKLLIGCTPEEMQLALTTHCQTRTAGVLIPRPKSPTPDPLPTAVERGNWFSLRRARRL